MADDDDPVIASYDVCLTSSFSSPARDSAKLYLLQYPSHRPYHLPYNAATAQTPTALRLKLEAGFIEVEVPMYTHEHYNEVAGERFGKAVAESRTINAGGSFGLAGGFGAGTAQTRLKDIPAHDQPISPAPLLETQTLGGKIPNQGTRDPIYLVGCFHQNQIHLSYLDAVVQMRPQLHHIDAEDETNQKRLAGSNNTGSSRQKPGLEQPTPKVESKAIEIKIRDTKDDSKDRTMNDNARQLRDIQMDEWQSYEWVDADEPNARRIFDLRMRLVSDPLHALPKLQSCISNGDWLDKMSAPREDGKKGLLAKLRGRERERARRKKAEEEKRQRQKEASGAASSSHGPLLGMSEDSDLSSPDVTDDDVQEEEAADNIQIKQEPAAPFPPSRRNLMSAGTKSGPSNPPKKRGRPRKNPPADSIPLGD
ncbi:uncharacterized protein Z520_01943 [Fonsecaea multimorphosa CBS 102226]|uniref:Uncharacterized protein n=1 Tax=Fonsecaea multimorphosa CBS 102226 TaxID=1442371 RepID=A0A0D2KEP1_9EURO|nr:uncharacterized protein Z520_01943 [Fonsecaea multimorphosa CBS 102226]KIY01805.1 hypothetical protein Z520_01943 [Fonsecaea multimorphosa CBS 102226]OAL29996.1 hypothetical protein AYO22_01902 [Fonsecaea multimorphosa]